MSPLNYIFQAHRWYYFKCEQNERGECENIFKIRPINVTMWLIAFSAGLYAIYYFLQKTIYGNLNDYFMLKINLTAFICALLSIGNSVMWNLKRDTLKILGLTSFRVYRKYFSRKEDVSLKKDVKIMSVFFWLFHFIGMLLNIFIMIFTRCDYIFWQVSNWICINYFSCLFFELDIFINVLVIYGEKLQKYIKNLKFETCDRKLMSKIFDTILYELNSFHRMYFSFVEMMYYIEDYLSLIVPLGFICIIPILVLICCAFFDVIIYPLKTSKDDIMLLASITGFGAPWVGYAGITILKLDKLKNMVSSEITLPAHQACVK